jgi:hypothetical protein
MTSGALSASVRPLRAAKPYVAGVPASQQNSRANHRFTPKADSAETTSMSRLVPKSIKRVRQRTLCQLTRIAWTVLAQERSHEARVNEGNSLMKNAEDH